MDFFTGIVIAVLIGYSLLKETLEESHQKKIAREYAEKVEKNARDKANAERQKEIEQQQALEAALKDEKRRPFKTSMDCFREQYVSYTRIKTYNSCPFRFKLIYLDKREKSSTGFLNTSKGTAFHIAVERYFKKYFGKVIKTIDYKEIVEEAFHCGYLEKTKYYWGIAQKEIVRRKRKIFRDNVKFFCKTFPEGVEIVAVEQELSFKVNNIKFYGIVDLILRYPDGHLEIVDCKTGIRLPIKEQLEIYSIPFTQGKNCSSISFRVICVDRQSHYRWSQNKEEMNKSSRDILSIVNTIINDNSFVPCIGSHCKNCSMRDVCKYSENYEKNGEISNRHNKLTRLTYIYEWKQGVMPPKSVKSKLNKGSTKRRDQGLCYSLSRAKFKYECFKTRRPIQVGEFHFVNHSSKRYSIEAFKDLYPERAEQLMEKRNQASIAKRKDQGLSYSMCQAKGGYKCHHTGRHIHIGEYHFVNHKGKRLCVDAFKELYPERAKQLKQKSK
jgi:RecB family exonuclease